MPISQAFDVQDIESPPEKALVNEEVKSEKVDLPEIRE